MTANLVNTEYKALLESGLTDDEWFAMSREQRAARTAFIYGRDLVHSMSLYDQQHDKKK